MKMSQRDDASLETSEVFPNEAVDSPDAKSRLRQSLDREETERLASMGHSPALLPQIVGGGVSALAQVAVGMVAGYSGVTIPQLTNGNTTISGVVFDDNQVALFSSVVYLTATVGCLVGIPMTVSFGQRTTMLICLPILLSGWVALYFSTTIPLILASRGLIGLTIGVTESASYQYTTETSHSSVRGMMVGALDTLRQIGVLLVYGLGATGLTWQHISLICGVTVPPAIIALVFLPDSPRWLVTRGRTQEASKSLAFFRGPRYDVTAELTSISSQVEDASINSNLSFGSQLRAMMQRGTVKVILYLTILFLAAQFTGNIVVMAYIIPILEATGISMNAFVAAMVVGGIRVVGTICSLLVVDFVGRKPALLVSFLTCGISLLSLGAFFFIKSHYDDVRGIDWIPMTCLVFFTFFSCVGHPTLNLVRGELLPTTVRSAAMPFLCSVMFGGFFLASQTFPLMTSSLGASGTFWIYGGMCGLVTVVTVAVIPETRKENLEDITLEKKGGKTFLSARDAS